MPVNSNYSLHPGKELNRHELGGWGGCLSEYDQAR